MYVSVHVDAEDVVDQVSTEVLISVLRDRNAGAQVAKAFGGLLVDGEEGLERVLQLLRAGLIEDAAVGLDRILHPKFKTLDEAQKAYAKRRAA